MRSRGPSPARPAVRSIHLSRCPCLTWKDVGVRGLPLFRQDDGACGRRHDGGQGRQAVARAGGGGVRVGEGQACARPAPAFLVWEGGRCCCWRDRGCGRGWAPAWWAGWCGRGGGWGWGQGRQGVQGGVEGGHDGEGGREEPMMGERATTRPPILSTARAAFPLSLSAGAGRPGHTPHAPPARSLPAPLATRLSPGEPASGALSLTCRESRDKTRSLVFRCARSPCSSWPWPAWQPRTSGRTR